MIQTELDQQYKSGYDQESSIYDKARFGSKKGDFAAKYKDQLILSILGKHECLTAEKTILDCPSGTGRVAQRLLKTNVGKIISADISKGMLAINEEKTPLVDKHRIEFLEANMKELPLDDNSIDVATMASFFYLVPAQEYTDYIVDIHRVLKPGGLLIAEISNSWTLFNPLTFLKILSHKYLQRKKVKSYCNSFEIPKMFKGFQLIESYGTEYPMLSRNIDGYLKLCKNLGSSVPFKWFGGKHTMVFQKKP